MQFMDNVQVTSIGVYLTMREVTRTLSQYHQVAKPCSLGTLSRSQVTITVVVVAVI